VHHHIRYAKGESAKFDHAVAETYADQNEHDCADLSAAVTAGRVEAQTGL